MIKLILNGFRPKINEISKILTKLLDKKKNYHNKKKNLIIPIRGLEN